MITNKGEYNLGVSPDYLFQLLIYKYFLTMNFSLYVKPTLGCVIKSIKLKDCLWKINTLINETNTIMKYLKTI